MNKEDLVKLVSTDTTWLSEKQHDELRSNLKVKFKHLGKTGAFEWFYNFKNGRYSAKGQGVAVDMDSDNKSWLSTKPINDDLNAEWTPFD